MPAALQSRHLVFLLPMLDSYFSHHDNGDSGIGVRLYRGIQSGFPCPPPPSTSAIRTSPTKSLPPYLTATGSGSGSNSHDFINSSPTNGERSKLNNNSSSAAGAGLGVPDKPGRSKVNVKESISKHQNWAKRITGGAGGSANGSGMWRFFYTLTIKIEKWYFFL